MLKTAFVAAIVTALVAIGSSRAAGPDILFNGGFEQGVVQPWITPNDQDLLEVVPTPVNSGQFAARLSGTQQQVHKARQSVDIAAGHSYQFSGFTVSSDPNVAQTYLYITWLDAGGLPIGASEPSANPLTGLDPNYRLLSTRVSLAPLRAARVQLEVVVQTLSTQAFEVFLDDFAFQDVTPPATPTSTSAPTVPPAITPTPVPTLAATSTPHATVNPTASPQPAPTPSQGAEPTIFAQLVNGGFEQLRDDGSAFGWHKQGGTIAVTSARHYDGAHALAFMSDTASTKWVYETVAVNPGAFYQASAMMLNGSGVDATFLRISWYGSSDGSGTSLSNSDSESLAVNGMNFSLLSTGPIPAPAGALSARVKLMLRPASDASAVAYFDDVTFFETAEGPASANTAVAGGPVGSTNNGSRAPSGRTSGRSAQAPANAVQDAVAAPIGLTNAGSSASRNPNLSQSDGGGSRDLIVLLGLASAAIAVGLVGYAEFRRRARGASNS